jgi:hypothetical protein
MPELFNLPSGANEEVELLHGPELAIVTGTTPAVLPTYKLTPDPNSISPRVFSPEKIERN